MASRRKTCIALTLLLTLYAVYASPSDSENDHGNRKLKMLVVNAKVMALVGACNAIKCPDIQYELVTTKIINKAPRPVATPSELAVLRVCGPSGLKLGEHYQFTLRQESAARAVLDKPVAGSGGYLDCDYVFAQKHVAPAPIEYWR